MPTLLLAALAGMIVLQASASSLRADDWKLWGGTGRNFVSGSQGLANAWPEGGPRKLWSRPLGDGYAAIAVENGRLYTGFRRESSDVFVALDAASGETIWEYAYDNPFQSAWGEVAAGPYAMPQIVGDRVLTASATGKIHALDKATGRPLWSRDLVAELAGTKLGYGYSCHGLPYGENMIYLVGGDTGAAVALRQSDGEVLWKGLSFKNAHSSPLLIHVDGQAQVVALLADQVIGFSPEDGLLLWSHPHRTEHGLAISTPVWVADQNILFISTAYGGGARAFELKQVGGETTVTQLWHDPKLELHFGSAIYRDGHMFFCIGHRGPTFFTAVELKSGAVKWQQRGYPKAQLVMADGKLVFLDQDGALGMVKPDPQRFEELARTPLLESYAWTPPTVVGTRLYVRDRKTMMALDLGESKDAGAIPLSRSPGR